MRPARGRDIGRRSVGFRRLSSPPARDDNGKSGLQSLGIRRNAAMNTNVDPRITRGANASKQDLRVWLAEMEAAGEVTHISGAEREREIGGIVDIYQRKIGNPGGAVRRHSRLPQGLPHPRQHPHLEPPHQHDDGQSGGRQRDRAGQALAPLHEGGQDLPAGRGEERRAAGERQDRRRHRPVQDSGAEVARARRRLLHRHRRHGGDEGSRHRLDQLRRLSRAGARQEASPP